MPADETSPIGTGTSDAPSASSGVEETGAGRLVTSAALIGAGMLIEPELLGGAWLGAGVMYGTVSAVRAVFAPDLEHSGTGWILCGSFGRRFALGSSPASRRHLLEREIGF
jgi:hypothetical protein